MTSPIFLLPAEVDEITRISDLTRWRMEKRGRFPRRIHLSRKRIAWRRTDIEAWADDPEGWSKRSSEQQEKAAG
jgi:predicted DNA-binding transcriptional regulator AlpA